MPLFQEKTMSVYPGAFSLAGHVAAITGAALGIGRAVALGFAEAGADIVCIDRDGDGVKAICAEVRSLGRKAIAVEADISSMEDVQKAAAAAKAEFGRVTLLVNSAGITSRHPAAEFPEDAWDRVIGVNLKGTFLCSKYFGQLMIENGGGRIVNLASIGGLVGYSDTIAYLSSKGGVVQMTRGLAAEWGKYNINVNAIAPGVVMTPMQAKLRAAQPDKFNAFLSKMAIQRPAEPSDIVGAAIFLSSSASALVTGHTLPVDGGYVAM